ncbi:hypothetical protein Hanom_Chr10g00966131 [Helianthus anomalus]
MFPEELTLPERHFNVKLQLDFLVEKVKCSLSNGAICNQSRWMKLKSNLIRLK